MDPISVTAAICSLLHCSKHLVSFVYSVRGARSEIDAISRELVSLQICLEGLENDGKQHGVSYSDDMKTSIKRIINTIELTCKQIRDMLSKLESKSLSRRIQWVAVQRAEVNSLRSSLESNKTALEIALQVGTISILARSARASIQQSTDMAAIFQQTEIITTNTYGVADKIDDLMYMHKDNSHFDEIRYQIATLREYMIAYGGSKQPKRQEFLQ